MHRQAQTRRPTAAQIYRERYGELPPLGQGGTPQTRPEEFQLTREQMTPQMWAERQRWPTMPDDVLIWRHNHRLHEEALAVIKQRWERRENENRQRYPLNTKERDYADIEALRLYVSEKKELEDKWNSLIAEGKATPVVQDTWRISQEYLERDIQQARDKWGR